jgi:hypothetical protein
VSGPAGAADERSVRRDDRGRSVGWIVALIVGVLALQVSAEAYLQLTVAARGQTMRLRWRQPASIAWSATSRGSSSVTAVDFQAAVGRAFAAWEAVPTASAAFRFNGFTNALPSDEDGRTTLGFESEPDLDRVLGATSFVIDTLTGDLVEADVFFNTQFPWSTAPGGDPAAFDLQSIATHEIGHLLGLGHSALGETDVISTGRRVVATGAVMFPIAFGRGNISDRTLQPDDIAGISDLYPDGTFEARTGVVQGRVRVGGRGVPGAHVVAFNPRTGALVGGFALGPEGAFQIAGLDPGPHVLRVEPLDDAEVESFFARTAADLNFRVTVHDRYLIAPAGGASASEDVTVVPK